MARNLQSEKAVRKRTGVVGLGRVQKRVLKVIRFPNRKPESGGVWTVREVAEIVYADSLEEICPCCGRGWELNVKQLMAVRQALEALTERGLVEEPVTEG